MDTLLWNIVWMLWNVLLGIFAVTMGWLTVKYKSIVLQLLFALLWILFIPNTIYMITDVYHLSYQWYQVHGILKAPLLIEFAIVYIIGVVTFIWGLYPFELLLKNLHIGKKTNTLYIVIFLNNFLIALGVTMGRVYRTNSWEVFTNPLKVIQDAFSSLTTDSLMLVIVFGVIGNIVYFFYKDYVVRKTKKALEILLVEKN